MTVIFLDECGHTGQDLLNRDQPFFVLASLALSEDECGELKRTYFQRVRARELKHSSLSRSRGHQDAVMNFLSDIGARQGIFKVNVTHKKYALVGKIVDLIIEPLMYENGIDMYNRGMNIATTNLFYHTIPIFGGEEFFNELLSKFQRMIRYRDRECFQDFFD
ncbi:MAG TPA: DUF3800 domain-containing protein, partial [Roseiflexaceae bacterium]|nr:DUF3800 domain-containing protein [Roseiflexaceae bacterium]